MLVEKKKISDLIEEAKEARGEAVRGPGRLSARLDLLAQPKRVYAPAHADGRPARAPVSARPCLQYEELSGACDLGRVDIAYCYPAGTTGIYTYPKFSPTSRTICVPNFIQISRLVSEPIRIKQSNDRIHRLYNISIDVSREMFVMNQLNRIIYSLNIVH